jgi:hypothetical protein
MYDLAISQLDKLGYSVLPALIPLEKVSACHSELQALSLSSEKNNHVLFSPSSCHIHNFFLHGIALRNTLFGPELREIHRVFFGPFYCLRNAVASSIHRGSTNEESPLGAPIGSEWHRDTPQFINRSGSSEVIGPGITYQVIISIDGSNSENSTKVIPESHRWSSRGHRLKVADVDGYKGEPEKNIILNPGDIAIIDDNLFHRAGTASERSRWMLFCSYTPWYIKPYFDFSKVSLPKMTSYEAHCLHKTATPPDPYERLRNTFSMSDWGEHS